jgi:hypothetical protein
VEPGSVRPNGSPISHGAVAGEQQREQRTVTLSSGALVTLIVSDVSKKVLLSDTADLQESL